ncbi:MAG: B12-binding domain-containing radical SAM protein [Acetobacteraceae bacterium]|nr:B12-binding domain-containing radical SAM protein [Acetobacteraceae bacterium]
MSDVLLIWPQALLGDPEVEALENRLLPLGLAYVGAALEAAGYSVAALDMVVERADTDAAVRACERERPRLVGLSCTSLSFGRARAVARAIKEAFPDTPLMMGGPHVTFADEETLASSPVDVIVRGEGEASAVEVARCLLEGYGELGDIQGVSLRTPNGFVRTADRPPLQNLDLLPLPARHLFPVRRYTGHPIVSSRGCPFKCIFCSAGAMAGGRYRLRRPESVVREVAQTVETHGDARFLFVDDTLTSQIDRTVAMCRMLAEQCPGTSWKCESRVDVAHPSLFAVMRDAGCTGLQFGVESGDPGILRRIGKAITPQQVVRAVEAALSAGFDEVVCSFIIGHPFDNEETVGRTLELARFLKDMGASGGRSRVAIRMTVLVPFPGTEVHRRASEWGLAILSGDWGGVAPDDILVETAFLSRRKLRALQFKSQTMLELGWRGDSET